MADSLRAAAEALEAARASDPLDTNALHAAFHEWLDLTSPDRVLALLDALELIADYPPGAFNDGRQVESMKRIAREALEQYG